MDAKTVWVSLVGLVVFGSLWLPTNYQHRELLPTDDPKYIRRVWADHTVGQVFHTRHDTDEIRLLARAQAATSELLHLTVGNQNFSRQVNLTPQDQWLSFKLPEALPAGEYTLTLSAPQIASQSEAILIRFQVSSTSFEPGYMVVDGEPSYGDIAFQFVDRVPAWKHVPLYFLNHPNHTLEVFRAVTLAGILYIIVSLLPSSRRAWRLTLLGLVIFSVVIRIPTLAQIDGVFGGDAFNYLSKAKAWLAGDDPFNADPRKGPFYPFLLIPTYLTDNPLLWSRFLGAISAGVAAAAVAATLRQLRVSPSLALLGGLLVSVNRELWWESLNGLANVPYTALVALATLNLAHNNPFATSLCVALTTLTRYEGILVGAVYIPALWIQNRFRLPTLRRSLIPLILLATPFVFWPISGALGVRTAGDLAGDSGLYIAWDWGDYKNNLIRTKLFFQELWFYRHEPPLSWVNDAVNLTAILGALLLARRRPIIAIALGLAAVLQLAVVTAILPKTRYYVQVIPLLAVGALYALKFLPRRAGLTLASLIVGSVWVNAWAHLPSFWEAYNHRGRTDSPLIQTAVYFSNLGGRPAFAINFLPVETYLPRSQTIFGAPENATDQLAWLREKNATHLVEVTEKPWFTELLATHPENFKHIMSFKASYDPAQAIIYEIQNL